MIYKNVFFVNHSRFTALATFFEHTQNPVHGVKSCHCLITVIIWLTEMMWLLPCDFLSHIVCLSVRITIYHVWASTDTIHLFYCYICTVWICVSHLSKSVFLLFHRPLSHRLLFPSVDASVCLWKPGCSSKSIRQGAGKRAEGLLIGVSANPH